MLRFESRIKSFRHESQGLVLEMRCRVKPYSRTPPVHAVSKLGDLLAYHYIGYLLL